MKKGFIFAGGFATGVIATIGLQIGVEEWKYRREQKILDEEEEFEDFLDELEEMTTPEEKVETPKTETAKETTETGGDDCDELPKEKSRTEESKQSGK